MTHDLPPIDDNEQDTVAHDADRTQAYTPPQEQPTRPYVPPSTDSLPTRTQSAQRQAHVQPIHTQGVAKQPPIQTKNQGRIPRQRPATQGQVNHPRPMSHQQPMQKSRRNNALYLPWWSLVLMLLVVLLASFLVVGGVYLLGGSASLDVTQEPIVRIITAQPSPVNNESVLSQPTSNTIPSTQIISQSDTSTTLELAGPTLVPVELTPTPQPITVGSVVLVSGVGDQELNIRDNAGILTTTVVFRSDEGERFIIIDGPTQADGFTWWQIQDTTNAARTGWAVANYLSISPDGS